MAPPPKTPQTNTLFKYFQKTPKTPVSEPNENGSGSGGSIKAANGGHKEEETPTTSSKVRASSISPNLPQTTPKSSHNGKKRRISGTLLDSGDRKKRLRPDSPGLFDSEFKEGSIVWAKLEGFPWWTAMVRAEVAGGKSSRKRESEFHVQFFDNPPSRAWIRKIDLKLYEGSQDGKVPPSKFDPAWVAACEEADNALKISPKKRLDIFWVNFDTEGEDDDDDVMSVSDDEQITPKPKASKSKPRDRKTKVRKRLKVIESSDDEDEDQKNKKRDLSKSPDDNKEKQESRKNAKKSTKSRRKDSDDSGDEYQPSPTKEVESLESEESNESSMEDEIPTSDNSDVEMVDEKKTTAKSKTNGRKSVPLTTPKSEVKSSVKSKLAQFTPSSSSNSCSTMKPTTPALVQEKASSDGGQQWPHLKLDFLQPNKIMDSHKRKPDHPDYDPGTLFIPESFLAKLTPAVKQWWMMKTRQYDTVLFFKVGKFYELYHMDAVIAVEELSITYMRGDFAHSGFPETAISKFLSQLIEKGYKVARIEQTETPEMMMKRYSDKSIKSTKFDKVVKREICQISTRGVRYPSFQDYNGTNPFGPESIFLYAINEDISVGSQPKFGVCFIDTTIGNFHIGQFVDDRHYSRLRTLLSHHAPAQILFERGKLCPTTQQIFSNYSSVRKDGMATQDFWDGKKALKYMSDQDIFSADQWPEAIKSIIEDEDTVRLTPHINWQLGLKSLGGVISYLKHCLLDHDLLSLRKFSIYNPVDSVFTEAENSLQIIQTVNRPRPKFMVLDGISLRNLDITEGPKNLLSIVNRCNTHFGKRLLRQWVCMPLAVPEEISERLDAVEELMSLKELADKINPLLKSLPDLERLLNKVHYLGSSHRSTSHPDSRAFFFEETKYSRNKIGDLTNIFKGFKNCEKIMHLLEGNDPELKSRLLCKLIKDFPKLEALLKEFDDAFDHNAALKIGKIIPKHGVDADFDDAKQSVAEIEDEANAYLKEIKKELHTTVTYFGSDKKRFQLEVPASTRVPKTYEMSSSKKGFKRYTNDTTKGFLAAMLKAEAKREEVLRDITRRIFEKFDKHHDTWKKGVDCIGEVDALLSLAAFSASQEDMCRPRVVYAEQPYIAIKDGRHPCIAPDVYIPNSCNIGSNTQKVESQHGTFILLTGPNMGGKSTLMRQVGLLAVLSHIGCFVPASDCEMSVVDRIFTRLGANDNIGDGESTFFVEMSETSAILKHSTRDSLILMDELGRGTATYDGTAIAYAVANALVSKGSRALFSTHYHTLVDSLENIPSVQLGHMACMVENENEDDPTQETITFLYKMSSGACPKSYGFNAARLAGIPNDVVRLAHRKAKEFEASVNKVDLFRKIVGGVNKLSLKGVKSMGLA